MRDKVLSLADAAKLVHDGMTVGIGGSGSHNRPMALIREIARQGRSDLTVQTLTSGIGVDLLIRAGCVARVETSRDGLEGGAPPSDGIVVDLLPESALTARLRAAAEGTGFAITRALQGTPLAEDSPHAVPIVDPFDGSPLHALRPARPDLTIIHAHRADAGGNVQFHAGDDPDGIDRLLAGASERVIVTVEHLAPGGLRPEAVGLSSDAVEAVVEAPYGAHPGSGARYETDAAALQDYLAARLDAQRFGRWLDRYVRGAEDQPAYLERSTTPERLAALSAPEGV